MIAAKHGCDGIVRNLVWLGAHVYFRDEGGARKDGLVEAVTVVKHERRRKAAAAEEADDNEERAAGTPDHRWAPL